MTPEPLLDPINLVGVQPLFIGRHRKCFPFPDDESKCIKVVRRVSLRKADKLSNYLRHRFLYPLSFFDINRRDYKAYRAVRDQLQRYLPIYSGMVRTDIGYGLAEELVRNYDGRIAQTVESFLSSRGQIAGTPLWAEFLKFFDLLRRHEIFLFDLNLQNFLVREKSKGRFVPIIIDLKRLGESREFLQLAAWSRAHAMEKLERRIGRVSNRILRP